MATISIRSAVVVYPANPATGSPPSASGYVNSAWKFVISKIATASVALVQTCATCAQ